MDTTANAFSGMRDDPYRYAMPSELAGIPLGRSGHPAFYKLLEEMADTHSRKNSDYANAADPFANFRACEKAGISMADGIYTRMSDKWERITNLLAKRRKGDGPAVASESLQDTLIDLANYAVILTVALNEATPTQYTVEPDDLKEFLDWGRVGG